MLKNKDGEENGICIGGENMLEVGYFKTASDAVKTIQFYAAITPDFHCTLKRVKLLGIYPVWVLRRWTK